MFHFPEPGELHNPSGIPISDDDAYWLLLGSGPAFVAFGEPEEWGEGQNAALLAWWNLMNALPKDRRILCQKLIRAQCDGWLPAAPWEDVAPDGTPL
jgi:hypothetical protein